MKEWYKTNFCNRRDWILDNLEYLALEAEEVLLCLTIDFLKSNGINPSYDNLMNKLKINRNELDKIIYNLTLKGCIAINIDSNGLFDLTPLFSQKLHPVSETEFESIFATFEEVFARPLSINEVQKLSDLMHDFDKDKVIDALRESEARNKLSLAYIEVILRNNNDVTKD